MLRTTVALIDALKPLLQADAPAARPQRPAA